MVNNLDSSCFFFVLSILLFPSLDIFFIFLNSSFANIDDRFRSFACLFLENFQDQNHLFTSAHDNEQSIMKTLSFNCYTCLTIWPALMLGALAASSQSARGLFILRSLNPES